MAYYILPGVLSTGFLDQTSFVTETGTADQLFDEANHSNGLLAGVKGLLVIPQSGNANSIFVGASNVTAAGAEIGMELIGSNNDVLGIPVSGTGADQVYAISTVGTDNITTMQVG